MNFNHAKKYTIKQKIINIGFLFVVFLGALIYFIIMPSINEINNLNVRIIDEKINILEQSQNEKNAIALNKRINEIYPDIATLESVFVNKNKELEFITILESIAHKNNITQKINLGAVEDLSKTSTKANKTVKSTESTNQAGSVGNSSQFSISANGKKNKIASYIAEINSLNYYINVHELDFTKISNDDLLLDSGINKDQIINVNISAKIYWK